MTEEKANRAKGKLRQSKSKLDTLLNITNAINDNASRTVLFSILKSVLIEELGIARFALFTFNSKEWVLSLTEGTEGYDCQKINLQTLINNYTDIGIINDSDSNDCLNVFDIIIPVYHKEKQLAYMVLADMEGEKIEISPIIKHLRFIQTLINIIVVALENKRLNKEQINQIAIKKELELAQSMQSLLFPHTLPNSKDILIKALYLPHSEVGGDYYDVVALKNNKVALCIADVSGKGMSAALLMANFQANLRALLKVSDNIEQLVEFCNDKIIESANYQKFITLFVAIFDPNDESLTYVNAGHQPPILFRKNEVLMLDKGSTVLGMFDELPTLTSEKVKLDKNSRMVCFTDGLTELEDARGNQLEAEGIKELLGKHRSLMDINTLLKNKIRELEEISGVDDDITFLAAEFLR